MIRTFSRPGREPGTPPGHSASPEIRRRIRDRFSSLALRRYNTPRSPGRIRQSVHSLRSAFRTGFACSMQFTRLTMKRRENVMAAAVLMLSA